MVSVSAAATRRFVASVTVERHCACGATFTVRKGGKQRVRCTDCVTAATEASRERQASVAAFVAQAKAEREAELARTLCSDCGTRLHTPGTGRCGLCDPEWDADAVLAQIDREHAEARAAA